MAEQFPTLSRMTKGEVDHALWRSDVWGVVGRTACWCAWFAVPAQFIGARAASDLLMAGAVVGWFVASWKFFAWRGRALAGLEALPPRDRWALAREWGLKL